MALVFECVHTEGIAELSYLIGDDSVGIAAVIDPRTDVEIYLQLAQQHKVSITHAFETHIHADFVSGSRELCVQTGTAKVYASIVGEAEYGFNVEAVHEGDKFEFGKLILTVRHTPGHTPEHISYEACEKGCDEPWGVFTGDSLFVNSAGRPDLLGKHADQLAAQLYDTLFGYYAKLADGVIIYPSHGHGSPCGADIGDRLVSTIGYELRYNPYFQKKDRKDFVEYALSTAPPEPAFYKRLKKVNAEGPEVLGHLPVIPALAPQAFKDALDTKNTVLIDTRMMLAFGGGHIEGALNIGATPLLTIWAGWLIDPNDLILLVLENDNAVEKIAGLFARSGFTKFAGYIVGGMTAWDNAGYPLVTLPQMTVHELYTCTNKLQILDVRDPSEWNTGHIPGATHMFLPEIQNRAGELEKQKTVITYCATGYRASLAASMLQRQGFKDVRTIPGSFSAWGKMGLPVEKEEKS
ncbi:MAG: MBL fold metallo-hydrolase [Parachlamydiaceae bacterium]|nr:MBL fold metallo-hydrolase [Parachlamydiaceae bacterium]